MSIQMFNNRIKRVIVYIVGVIMHPFLKVKKGRVVCIAYGGSQYSCNPRYISEYITKNHLDVFDVYWLFTRDNVINDNEHTIKAVKHPSIRSIFVVNTSEYVITNKRTEPRDFGWIKKKNQKYIMTWHGGRPLKRIEMDAINTLGPQYLRRMKHDSEYCDLFLSESRYTSNLYNTAFLYNGEILEKGIPRNDIFFNTDCHGLIKKQVFGFFGFNEDDKVVLYAPTFRGKMNLDCYNIDWKLIIPAFEKMLGGRVKVLIRLHPNFLRSNTDRSSLFSSCDNLIEATSYDNINDLIISSDVMISDYSSCMFDFAFTQRPCFIYATDSARYERGFYLNISELPFPFAENNNQLLENISSFNYDKYKERLNHFMKVVFGSFDSGQATKKVVEWMICHSIK